MIIEVPFQFKNQSDLVLQRWKHQHLAYASPEEWCEGYTASTGLPSRGVVLEGLEWLQPWQSLAEPGCNTGPMLSLVRDRFPEAELTGIEPNSVAAQSASDRLSQSHRVSVSCESLQEWLLREPEIDVIVTHYTLAYIPPEEIRPVLAEMCRAAKRGLVLAEPMGSEVSYLTNNWTEWSHDYVRLLHSLGKTEMVMAEIDPPIQRLNGVLACRW